MRWLILSTCDERDAATLKLGTEDEDGGCRFSAYEKIRHPEPETVEAVLKSEDQPALHGLVRNGSVSLEDLRKLRDRLRELGDDDGERDANKAILEREGSPPSRPPEDPWKLFGPDGREGDFLQDKIDLIGKMLLKYGPGVDGIERLLDEGLSTTQSGILFVIVLQVVILIYLIAS